MQQTMALQISDETLPGIQAVVAKKAVRNSALFMLFWGALNFVAGLLIAGVVRPRTVLQYVATYHVVVLGLGMLGFAIYGLTSRHLRTIMLCGVTLIGIGILNLSNDLLDKAAFNRVNIDPRWYVFGVLQILWGVHEIKKSRRLSTWVNEELPREQAKAMLATLTSFTKQKEDYKVGRITGTSMPQINRPVTPYVGQIGAESLILIAKKVNDMHRLEKSTVAQSSTAKNGVCSVMLDGRRAKITLGAESLAAIKVWADIPFTPDDIKFLVQKKATSLYVLVPLLQKTQGPVRADVVRALTGKKEEGAADIAASLVHDPHPAVRAAAMDACRTLKVGTLQQAAIEWVKDPNGDLRRAAGDYLADFPTSQAVSLLQHACLGEQNKTAARALKKACKKCESVV